MVTIWQFLITQPLEMILSLFWFMIIFDVPRYVLGFTTVFLTAESHPPPVEEPLQRISVLLAGHNEEASLERCVASIHAQEIHGLEIIAVDDGSTDGTYRVIRRLEQAGLIHRSIRLHLRGGKAPALNLAATMASGDVFVVIDCDCSLERHGLHQLLAAFDNPRVGAVAGNILVRNWKANSLTAVQAVEYLFSISLGRSLLNDFGLVTCISGAFGAFRCTAWSSVGGMDVGPGEDFDITLRLRRQGYKIRFARDAICQTDVPETLPAFIRQRNRWERDAFAIRLRKFGSNLNPFHEQFSWREVVHQLDFLIYELGCAAIFPLYLAYLALAAPELALYVLGAAAIVLCALDVVSLLIATTLMRRPEYLRLLPFLPLFGLFAGYVMRFIRLYAYLDELIFSSSRHDSYVPQKAWPGRSWR